jgi:protein SCO1
LNAIAKVLVMHFDRRHWLQSAAATALLPWAAGAAAQAQLVKQTPAAAMPWSTIAPRELMRREHLPDVRLRTHQGREVRFYEDLIKDNFVLINFIYMNCSDGTCPVTTYNLTQVQKLLKDRVGRDIFMYSITIDPENDTPELLDRYAKSFHVGPGWLFLRATPKDTEVLRRALGFADTDPAVDGKKSNHLAKIRIGNEPHVIWAAASAMSAPANIVKNILLADRSTPKNRRSLFG